MITIESPYAPSAQYTLEQNCSYLDECIRFTIHQGETPVAGHRMYTSCLDDQDPVQRKLGIVMHNRLIDASSQVWVFIDHGISAGMAQGIYYCHLLNKPLRFFSLYHDESGPAKYEYLRTDKHLDDRDSHYLNTVWVRLAAIYPLDVKYLDRHDLGNGFFSFPEEKMVLFSQAEAARPIASST